MMTGASEIRRISRQVSIPPIPGMFTSSRTKSGRCLRKESRASSPVLASLITYPCELMVARITRRICGSSSTTKIFAAVNGPPFARGRREDKTQRPNLGQIGGSRCCPVLSDNQRLRNRQTHARSTHQVTLILAAVKLVEDHGLLEFIDSRTAVGDAGGDCVSGQLGGNGDRLILRGIEVGIVNQLYQRLFSSFAVGAHRRQVRG